MNKYFLLIKRGDLYHRLLINHTERITIKKTIFFSTFKYDIIQHLKSKEHIIVQIL